MVEQREKNNTTTTMMTTTKKTKAHKQESNDFQAKGLKFFKKRVVNNVKCCGACE